MNIHMTREQIMLAAWALVALITLLLVVILSPDTASNVVPDRS